MFNREMKGLWRWNLFWWKVEGAEALNGINVYHPDDPISAGFVLRIWRFGFKVRYSKRAKRWVIGAQKYSFKDTWLPFKWSLDFTIDKGNDIGIKTVDDHREFDKKTGKYYDES